MTKTTTHPIRHPSTIVFCVATAFYLFVQWRAVGAVWNDLELPGPDDFLRLHQVLNLLGGQNWFDMTAYRMAPPEGADIHWSRFVDLPIAALILLFQLAFDQETALRLVAITWPFLLFIAGLFAMIRLCRILVSAANPFIVLFFYVLGIATMAETSPGRLDHHNLQILLFIVALTGLVRKPGRFADFTVAASIVVSLSIGLDSAALFLPLLVLIGVQWALGFENHASRLMRVGGFLVLVSGLVFVTTVPADKWHVASCDAFSLFYLTALLVLGVAFVALSLIASPSPVLRLAMGAIVGACALVMLLWLFPDCASGPYGNVSPELEARWLSKIQEAKGIFAAATDAPERWLGDLVYVMLILLLAVLVTWKRFRSQPGWIVLFATVLICAVGLFFQIRILRTGIMAAVPFGVLFAVWVWEWVDQQKIQMQLAKVAAVCLICLPLTSFFWYTAGVLLLNSPEPAEPVANEDGKAEQPNKRGCRANSDYALLRSLPSGIIMSDINSATPILVHSGHKVVSGPYHRNGDAILAVTNFFETDSQTARKTAAQWQADYVAYCDQKTFGEAEVEQRIDVRIAKGNLPEWLELVSPEEDTLKVLRIKK